MFPLGSLTNLYTDVLEKEMIILIEVSRKS
jgi:hypothetical protein